MEWTDEAIVLGAKRHGDSHAVLSVLSREHGRHLGLVRGTRRLAGALQPGNGVRVTWRGRLSDHLGTYTVEPAGDRAGAAMANALTLAALSSACAVASGALPEREAHTPVYESFRILLDALGDSTVWPALYVRWEVGLLQDLGFGLDLSKCTVTGQLDDLAYVSPRTGRAVSAEAAADWKDRLFPLPAFLLGRQAGEVTHRDVLAGLNMSGWFLEQRIFAPHNKPLPPARVRLAELLGAKGA
ncbi:MAG: DNA repair protein RecO [Alphaproteobacteria bacterium]